MKGVILGMGLFIGGTIVLMGLVISCTIIYGSYLPQTLNVFSYSLIIYSTGLIFLGLYIALKEYIKNGKEKNK